MRQKENFVLIINHAPKISSLLSKYTSWIKLFMVQDYFFNNLKNITKIKIFIGLSK